MCANLPIWFSYLGHSGISIQLRGIPLFFLHSLLIEGSPDFVIHNVQWVFKILQIFSAIICKYLSIGERFVLCYSIKTCSFLRWVNITS